MMKYIRYTKDGSEYLVIFDPAIDHAIMAGCMMVQKSEIVSAGCLSGANTGTSISCFGESMTLGFIGAKPDDAKFISRKLGLDYIS